LRAGRGEREEVRSRMSDVNERRGRRSVREEGKGEGESMETKQINSAKDLRVYKKAYALAIDIFKVSKKWPSDEKYSLTDQTRRASRSVCANLREAWAKRRYAAHFVSKLTDVDGENSETDTWLDFAMDCGYLSVVDYNHFTKQCKEIGAMLGSMLNNPTSFLIKG